MRMLAVTALSTFLSFLVISNAYAEKRQFYPTVVYLLSSNRSLGVIYLQSFVMVWFLCKFLKCLFFGTLRAAEVEHLIESSWYAILETFILLAAFHQELSIGFVTMVTVLFIAKSFHWLAQDRVDYMERSPVITWLFHIRAVVLFTLLLLVDYLFVRHSWSTLHSKGPSVEIVFGLEYAIMFLSVSSSVLHYILHTIDRQSEDPWENKTIYVRLVDIVLGFFKLALYISYMAFMLYVLFIPLHIARRVYVTAKNFQKSIHDVIASQQAIRHLNTLYPDASVEELEAVSNVCIICREEMVSRCKKLPCKHIFHTTCLQSWFQRQQTCPTCRMNVLNRTVVNRLAQPPVQPRPRRQQVPQQQQQQPFNPQQNNGFLPPPPPMMFPHMMPPPMWPHPPQQPQAQQPGDGGGLPQPPPPPQQPEANNGDLPRPEEPVGLAPPPGAPNMTPPQVPPQFPMGMAPPFPFPPPPFLGFPPAFGNGPISESIQSLSTEQLHQLEGMERANVEARIAVLRDVQKLLDGAVLRLNQYSAVMGTLSPPAGPGFPGYPYPPFFQPQPTAGSGEGTDDIITTVTPPAEPPLEGAPPPSGAAASSGLFQGSTNPRPPQESEHSSEGVVVENGEIAVNREREVETIGVEDSPPHVDAGIRQRRLNRFHSLPDTTQQSLSPLLENRDELRTDKDGNDDQEQEVKLDE